MYFVLFVRFDLTVWTDLMSSSCMPRRYCWALLRQNYARPTGCVFANSECCFSFSCCRTSSWIWFFVALSVAFVNLPGELLLRMPMSSY